VKDGCCGGDRWETIRPVMTAPGEETYGVAIAADLHAVAIVLDLMHPVGASRRLVGAGRDAGRDVPVGARYLAVQLPGPRAIGNRRLCAGRREVAISPPCSSSGCLLL
jgi:hypothetical protein